MASNFYINLGIKIRTLRKSLKFSREKLAELADINTYYLGEIERGEKRASLDTLMKLCTILNIKIYELLNLE